MSWMGALWHMAPQAALAEAIAQLPGVLGTLHPLFAVHTWPAGAGMALRAGPLPEHSVRWRDAAGRGKGLALEPLGGGPSGGSLRRCSVALAGFFDLTPQGWQLGFGDRPVFCFSGKGRHWEACVHIGAAPSGFGFRSENWVCHWRLLAEVGP